MSLELGGGPGRAPSSASAIRSSRYATSTPSRGSSAGASLVTAVGRIASSARAPVRWATARASAHAVGSSSGPEAATTRAPERRTSSVAWSAERLGLIGAKMPTASAASSSGSIVAQLTETTADGVAPPDPQLGEDGGGSVDVAGEPRERQRERRVEVLGVRSTDTAGRSGHRHAARVTSS